MLRQSRRVSPVTTGQEVVSRATSSLPLQHLYLPGGLQANALLSGGSLVGLRFSCQMCWGGAAPPPHMLSIPSLSLCKQAT